jgi:hypothetical protein
MIFWNELPDLTHLTLLVRENQTMAVVGQDLVLSEGCRANAVSSLFKGVSRVEQGKSPNGVEGLHGVFEHNSSLINNIAPDSKGLCP